MKVPTTSKDWAKGITPVQSILVWVGLIENNPQAAAGIRIEPPVSVPSPKSASLAATADAEPDYEPPVNRSG